MGNDVICIANHELDFKNKNQIFKIVNKLSFKIPQRVARKTLSNCKLTLSSEYILKMNLKFFLLSGFFRLHRRRIRRPGLEGECFD